MTIRVNKKTGDVLLFCDGMFCASHEHLGPGFDNATRWIDRNAWRAHKTDGGRWKHYCEACECKRRGLPADYRERLHAY